VVFYLGITSIALIEIWQPMVKEVVIESVKHGTSMNLPYFHDLLTIKIFPLNLKNPWKTVFCYCVHFLLFN